MARKSNSDGSSTKGREVDESLVLKNVVEEQELSDTLEINYSILKYQLKMIILDNHKT